MLYSLFRISKVRLYPSSPAIPRCPILKVWLCLIYWPIYRRSLVGVLHIVLLLISKVRLYLIHCSVYRRSSCASCSTSLNIEGSAVFRPLQLFPGAKYRRYSYALFRISKVQFCPVLSSCFQVPNFEGLVMRFSSFCQPTTQAIPQSLLEDLFRYRHTSNNHPIASQASSAIASYQSLLLFNRRDITIVQLALINNHLTALP